MKDRLKKIHEAVKTWVTQVFLKKFLTPVVLVLVYYFILGPTSIVARIFFRSALSKSPKTTDSNWLMNNSFETTLESSRKQS